MEYLTAKGIRALPAAMETGKDAFMDDAELASAYEEYHQAVRNGRVHLRRPMVEPSQSLGDHTHRRYFRGMSRTWRGGTVALLLVLMATTTYVEAEKAFAALEVHDYFKAKRSVREGKSGNNRPRPGNGLSDHRQGGQSVLPPGFEPCGHSRSAAVTAHHLTGAGRDKHR
ncbi:MAG: hypothetical protein IPI95_13245 [Flavobacteriales bacterium]|nr:hypothetical protein [Flavobacteriales bacterium]